MLTTTLEGLTEEAVSGKLVALVAEVMGEDTKVALVIMVVAAVATDLVGVD